MEAINFFAYICKAFRFTFRKPVVHVYRRATRLSSARLSARLSVVCHGRIVAKRCEKNLGCYWPLIGSRILALKWHDNHWPWMTLKCHNALWYPNAVFNSKFETQFDNKPSQTRTLGFRVEDDLQNLGFNKKNVLPTTVSTNPPWLLKRPNCNFSLRCYDKTTILTQKCSNANSLSFAQSFHII